MQTYVLFGIRDDELRSPFVMTFIQADSFKKAAAALGGSVTDAEHTGWRAYMRISSLLPSGTIEHQMFEPGNCTAEKLVEKDKVILTDFDRHQAMQFQCHQLEKCIGFVLATPSE